MSHRYVWLEYRKNRGWPWPESSFGLTPMYGEDGWCPACGVPNREQRGSLILKRNGFAKVRGAWTPFGMDDTICLERSLAEEVSARFDVKLWPVSWPKIASGEAFQLIAPVWGESWFDPEELRKAALRDYGKEGAECATCGVWRWMPLVFKYSLPPLRIRPPLTGVDVAASPEWFGDGWKAFRQVLVRRELAELVAEASPQDFKVTDVAWH